MGLVLEGNGVLGGRFAMCNSARFSNNQFCVRDSVIYSGEDFDNSKKSPAGTS